MEKYFTLAKLEFRLKDIQQAIIRETRPIGGWESLPGDLSQKHVDDLPATGWKPFQTGLQGDRWGQPWEVRWFRSVVTVPDEWRDRQLSLGLDVGSEALVYLNGKPVQGVDWGRDEIVLPAQLIQAGTIILHVKARTVTQLKPGGNMRPESRLHDFARADLQLRDPVVEDLYFSMWNLLETAKLLDEHDLARQRILRILDDVYHGIDFTRSGKDALHHTLVSAYATLMSRQAEWKDGHAARPLITAIGHSHIDTAWLWPLAHTREKCAHTWSTVLHHMQEYPDFKFIQSQAQLYEFVEQDHPELFQKIRQAVRDDRWEADGALWVECDCNITGGESLIRQILFGTRYFREKLGRDCDMFWLPDTFGYSWALPQIIAKSGLKYFVTSKISWNQYNRLPCDSFWWRGVDGTEVLAHFLTTPAWEGYGDNWFTTYNGNIRPGLMKGTWDLYQQKDLHHEVLTAFGWGDGGGGPTREMIENARRIHKFKLPGVPDLQMAFMGGFLDRLRTALEGNPRAPVWNGELYLEFHRGTYTSQAKQKRDNRKSEFLMQRAELWAAWAHALARPGYTYPQTVINEAWKLILLNQFHDILPGTSIPEVYLDSQHQYREVEDKVGRVSLQAICALCGMPSDDGVHLAVFNAVSRDRTDIAVIPGACGNIVQDADGTPVRTQNACDGSLLFLARVPSMGYASYALRQATGGDDQIPGDIVVTPGRLETPFAIVAIDDQGRIRRLYDKINDREVLPEGAVANELQAFEDRPMRWDCWDIDLYYQCKQYPVDHFLGAEVVETGPIRGILRLKWKFLDSSITQDLMVYGHSPRIDFATNIHWRNAQVLLKAAFPVQVHAGQATYEIQFGNVQRPTHWNTSWDWARFETCAHKWADLSEGDYGVAILNDCKYGHDIKDHVLRITLIKAGTMPDPKADIGQHTFTYSLLPHAGTWMQGKVPDEAYALNQPLETVRLADKPSRPEASFLHCDASNIRVESIKKAEDSADLIVRLYEFANCRGKARLFFDQEIASAGECNLVERECRHTAFRKNEMAFTYTPYEIKTFKVRFRI